MKKSIKDLFLIVFMITSLCLILIIGVFIYSNRLNKKEKESEKITSTIIIDKIQEQQFLVTKSVYFDEEIKIEIKKDSKWHNLLWGQTIDAEGIVRMDLGVDLKKLDENNIEIDHLSKTIFIDIPQAEILDSSLFGKLEIQTKKGILANIKEVFSDEEGQDYNMAVEKLIQTAETNLMKNEDFFIQARDNSKNIINLILNDLDYKTEFK